MIVWRSSVYMVSVLVLWTVSLCAPASPTNQRSGSIREWGFLKDPSSQILFKDIVSKPPTAFTSLKPGLLSEGFTRTTHWIRFVIDAEAGDWIIDTLPPYLDNLKLYTPDPTQPSGYLERQAGDHYPFELREVAYRGFAFRLAKKTNDPIVCFLRLESTSTHHLVLRLWPEKVFFEQMALETGTVYGLLAVLVTFLILNLNNWFWLREKLLLWLCLYIGSLVFLYGGILGFLNQHFLPQVGRYNDLCLGLGNMAVMASSSAFYPRLFGLGPQHRIVGTIYRIGFWLPFAGVMGVFADYYPEMMPPLHGYYMLVTVVGVFVSWRLLNRSEPDAILVFLATVTGLIGALVVLLNLQGFLLGGLSILYSMMAASIIQIGLLHLAIAARYRRLEREQVRQEERVNQAVADADRERRERSEQSGLFAMISHEIRTPLTMIIGAVQSLEHLVESTDDIDRRHDRIRRAVTRIDELVDSALMYDRVEGAATDGNDLRPVDLRHIVLDLLSARGLKPARLIQVIPEQPLIVTGQYALLEIMASNLIDNALKYTPESALISVVLGGDGTQAFLAVEDNGPGIPKEMKNELFRRYVRGAVTEGIPGTGLGLFLVDQIARLHGGTVTYSSVEPSGARFVVELPIQAASKPNRS